MKRIIFDIVLFLSIFILPWWVSVILAFFGIFIFPQFYEFVACGALMYILYAVPNGRILSSPVWYPLILSALYLGIQAFRRYVVIYNKNEI